MFIDPNIKSYWVVAMETFYLYTKMSPGGFSYGPTWSIKANRLSWTTSSWDALLNFPLWNFIKWARQNFFVSQVDSPGFYFWCENYSTRVIAWGMAE